MSPSAAAKPTVILGTGLAGLRRLLEADYELLDEPASGQAAFAAGAARGARAIVVVSGNAPLDPDLAALPELGLVAVIGTGYEAVDVAALRERGVEVTNSPNANHEDVADLAIGLLLASVRRIVEGDRVIRAGGWRTDVNGGRAARSMKTLSVGVAGLGAIGWAVAERLQPFGCQVSWWGPRPKPDAPWPRAETLLALAKASDVLVLALRADATTVGLVDRTILEALGRQGLLVNIARGSVVDEDALIAALKDGRLGGAALDVFEVEPTPAPRWADVPNLVLTPHLGGNANAAVAAMLALVRENLRLFFAGEPVATPVPPPASA